MHKAEAERPRPTCMLSPEAKVGILALRLSQLPGGHATRSMVCVCLFSVGHVGVLCRNG